MSNALDCLFCDDGDPCPAHAAKPSKPPKKRVLKPKAEAPAPPPVAAPTAPTEDAPWESKQKQTRFESKVADKPEISDDDRVMREAIRNLWPILAPSEKRKYQDIAFPPKTAAELNARMEVRRRLDANVPR